jgi:hypothetical protein
MIHCIFSLNYIKKKIIFIVILTFRHINTNDLFDITILFRIIKSYITIQKIQTNYLILLYV